MGTSENDGVAWCGQTAQRRPMRRLGCFLAAVGLVAAAIGRPFIVVAYNVENLVDVDGVAAFEDYQPARYSRAHALTKLQNIARVLARFEDGRGPDVVLFSELEADATPGKVPLDHAAFLALYAGMTIEDMLGARFDREIADLPAEALLLKTLEDRGLTGYTAVVGENVVMEGTARRLAQTCAVFTRFPIKAARSHPTLDARAILDVQLEVDGATFYVFANHWKAGAGDSEMEKTRRENARTLRSRLNEIFRADPNADVIIGGDFNSHHNQKQRYPQMKVTGINDVLGSQGNELAVRGPQRDLYNLWFELPVTQRGSDTYRGEWGTLMNLIVSRGLYDFRGVQYVDNSFAVAKFAGLNADVAGVPVRWSSEGPAGSGFSDHFPVFAKFVTVADGRTDRYLALRNASVDRGGPAPSTKIDYAKLDLGKLAVSAADVPAGVNLRTDHYKGKIFRVEGRVAPGGRLAVEFLGEIYDVWSFDEALRNRLRAEHKEGDTLRFYGELGAYRGRWQFVIRDPSWVR